MVIVSDLHFTDETSGETVRSGAFKLFSDALSNLAYGASWRANGKYKPVEDLYLRRGRQRKEKVSEDRVGKTAASGFGILRRGKTDPFRGPWKHPALKARLDLPFRGGREYVTGWPEKQNGNSG